jgi:hypothetical protein
MAIDKLTSQGLAPGAVTVNSINDNEITAAKLHTTAIQDKLGYTPVDPATLSDVATSGSYVDLSNKPTLGNLAALNTISSSEIDSGAAVANIGYTPVNKAGDTMTGNLTIAKINPAIYLKDTADEGVDVAIGAYGENFFIFEPEDDGGTQTPASGGKQWLRIEDDGDAFLMGNRRIWHNSAMPKPVINVSNYENGSMITASASANTTYFTFDVQKISSTSLLYVTGNIPTSGSDNHGLYYFVSFNGTRKFRGISDSLRAHGAPSSSVPGMININTVSQSGIGAGTITIGVGIQPASGGSNRPIYYLNPNTSIDDRNISGTVITVWEVEQ